MKQKINDLIKMLLQWLYEFGLIFGFIILPVHYYVPFPDLRALRKKRALWARRSEMIGVDFDLDRQVATLRKFVAPFEVEYRGNRTYKDAVEGAFGPGYGFVEAQALHAMVRSLKPRRIIEIGSGVSTYCMLKAIEKNGPENSSSVTCVEPYPSTWLRRAPVKLIESPVQDTPLELFETLATGDFLFVDSTHTVQLDGDVNRIILEILPRLASGVIVHFHDIYLPYDFSRDADRSIFRQWMETPLLHAYLIGNRNVEIMFSLSQLHYDRQETLREVFPEYVPDVHVDGIAPPYNILETTHFPASTYLVTKAV